MICLGDMVGSYVFNDLVVGVQSIVTVRSQDIRMVYSKALTDSLKLAVEMAEASCLET